MGGLFLRTLALLKALAWLFVGLSYDRFYFFNHGI